MSNNEKPKFKVEVTGGAPEYNVRRPLGEFDAALDGLTLLANDKNPNLLRIENSGGDTGVQRELIKAMRESGKFTVLPEDDIVYNGTDSSPRNALLELRSKPNLKEAIAAAEGRRTAQETERARAKTQHDEAVGRQQTQDGQDIERVRKEIKEM